MRYWAYLRYVVVHKWYVLRAACGLGVPWLGLVHDASKLLLSELVPYARHFYETDGTKKTRPGPDGFFDDEPTDAAFDRAWLLHISRNRHHPQHYVALIHSPCHSADHARSILFEDDGSVICLDCRAQGLPCVWPRSAVEYTVQEMPERYRREMLADWIGAGAAQGTPDTSGWYLARGHRHPLGPETRAWIEQRLLVSPDGARHA